MPKFDWNQFPTESKESRPSGSKSKKFNWDDFETEPKPEPSMLSQAGDAALKGISYIGEKIDQYGGAPTRAAISSLQDDVTEPGRALDAFKNQFGSDPKKAPTGRDIVRKAGVPDTSLSEIAPSLYNETGEGIKFQKGGWADPTASGVAGVAMDIAADPTSALPLGAVAKGVAKTASKSASTVGRGVSAVGNKIAGAGTKVTTKLGNLFTGVPEKEIETYIKRYPEVQKLIKEYGDDVPGAADKIREGFQASIRAKRMSLGNEVGSALDALPNEKVVNISPVVEKLSEVKNRMNKSLRFEEVKQIDDLIERVNNLAGDGGMVTPKEMFEIKQFMQERGSGAFMKNGQIFVPGKDAQKAAKNASGAARDIVNTMSPSVADANRELSRLHTIESRINKNLIAPGKNDSALATAGSGANPRNAKELQLLENVTGGKIITDAENFAAMKRFANPGLSAADTTGKAAERMLKAGLIGQAVGGPVAAGIAALATSPLALKTAIQAGRVPAAAIRKLTGAVGSISEGTIDQAYKILQTPQGQKAFEGALQGAKVVSIDSRAKGALKNVADEEQPKGEDRWARNGLKKLGIQDQEMASKLLNSKEGKRLLIQASDLPVGSTALKKILESIQKGNDYVSQPSSGSKTEGVRQQREPARGR